MTTKTTENVGSFRIPKEKMIEICKFGWRVCSKHVLMYSSCYDPTHDSGEYSYYFKNI